MSTLQVSARRPRPPRRQASLTVLLSALASVVVAPPVPAATAWAGSGRVPSPVRHARVTLSTGVELHVAEAGPADGEPVLFLHGITDSWYAWSPVLERLPEKVRAIVPSQRGHGDSGRPECCYAIADFAADAVALLDALGVERATVVGHSMGSFIAQRVAIESPERVRRLVLVGSGLTPRSEGALEIAAIAQGLEDPLDPGFVREFQESTVATSVPSDFLERVIAESLKVPARVWRDAFAGLVAPDGVGNPSRIETSTLVVSGANDGIWPPAQRDALVGALPRSRVMVHGLAGHAPHWEDPRWFTTALEAFLSSGGSLLDAGDRLLPLGDVTLRYRDLGGSREPVVLLHGYTDSLEDWARVADSLTRSHRVIALDLRGFGRSRLAPGRARFGKAMAGDVLALLDALEIPAAHLVGYSLGALVATTATVRAPDRVRSLTLLAPPLLPDSAEMAGSLAPFVEALEHGGGLAPFFGWVYPAASRDAIGRSARAALSDNDSTVLVEVLRAMGGLVPTPADLERVPVPVLIAVGDADPFSDEGRVAAKRLRARLITMPGGDHSAPILEPWWLPTFREMSTPGRSRGLVLGPDC